MFLGVKTSDCSWMFKHMRGKMLKQISNLRINNKVCFCFIHVDMRPFDTYSSDSFVSSKKGWIVTSSQLPPAGLVEQQHTKTPPPPSLPVRFLRTGWSNTLLFVVWWENAASQKKRARRTMMKRSCGCHADAGSCDGRPGEKELGHGEMVARQKTWWEQCGCPWLRSRPASSSHNHERNCRDSLWGVWGY